MHIIYCECLKVAKEGVETTDSGSEFQCDTECGTKEFKKQVVCAKGWYKVKVCLYMI